MDTEAPRSNASSGSALVVLFHGLVATSSLILIRPYFRPTSYEQTADVQLSDLLTWDGYGGVGWDLPALYLVLLVLFIAAHIGLFLYLRIARAAFAALLGVNLLLPLVEGVRVVLPLESLQGGVIFAVDGALVAMAYFTRVAGNFAGVRARWMALTTRAPRS